MVMTPVQSFLLTAESFTKFDMEPSLIFDSKES